MQLGSWGLRLGWDKAEAMQIVPADGLHMRMYQGCSMPGPALLPLPPAAAPLCSAEQKTGYAIHMYTANMSMEDSCLANADGDMLIVPQQGAGRQAGRVLRQHTRHPLACCKQAGRQAGCCSSTRAGQCVRGCAPARPLVPSSIAAALDVTSLLLPLPSRDLLPCLPSFLPSLRDCS